MNLVGMTEISDYNSALNSFEEIICKDRGTGPARGSSVLNSSCSSPCTSSVLCNSKTTNHEIGQRGKLQLSDNTNRGGQGGIEINLHFTGRKPLISVAPEMLIDFDTSFKCCGVYLQGWGDHGRFCKRKII